MTKSQGLGGDSLESREFFSTSEYARVPPNATHLFIQLVQRLLQYWECPFRAAETRLAMKRTELLRANGGSPDLIRDLLGDAQLWDLIRRSYNKQFVELKAFLNCYVSRSWSVLRENKTVGRRYIYEGEEEFFEEINKGHF
ncbi:ankyrin-2 [Penicillium odoratum]|uniref:ankyrin-2 n=1 Tax=Penicillium odoratum TaxID=1167516 RepID=UPI002546939D|nr:ankyrin-2 [Penicillium odoratum]KAJ5772683.1 ankyrin-2 [Penicillium odoratum]